MKFVIKLQKGKHQKGNNVLISKKDIIKYLNEVPPIPQSVKNALEALSKGDLKKAAQYASDDLVLKKRIENVVNSAYYALPNKVEDIVQLFAMLGVEKTRSLIYSYLVSLLEPKQWKIFKIDFFDFQAAFMSEFEKAMNIEFDNTTYKKYAEISAIIPAAVCVCDSLLGDRKDDVELIMGSAPLEYSTLIKRMTGVSLFGLAAQIAKIWGLNSEKVEILKKAECETCDDKIAALTHLIFFSLVSKKQFLDLNSLIEFNPECINLVPKTYERIANDS